MKPLDEAVAARRKALMVSGLRGLAKPKPPASPPAASLADAPADPRPQRYWRIDWASHT